MPPRSLVVILLLVFALVRPAAADMLGKWLGQTVYVPVYSHIYGDDRYRGTPFLLTATLSIRNTDPDKALLLKSIRYYDSNGVLLQEYLEKPVAVPPFGSTRYIVPESESKGGSGAKFLVEWEADSPVVEPIIESVMIGTKMQQGISFISTGRAIKGTPVR
ncbi:DUF3124 domain-containing protein [Desulfobulbus sp.]|uniref:DUF3124 domain-containing protein n=1 Tax=Desulfobulbus sp. TaxID=895 RepID=UPI00286F8DC3|nr:DUF3124 domain-containing protein [Desulfobulbus sp.]